MGRLRLGVLQSLCFSMRAFVTCRSRSQTPRQAPLSWIQQPKEGIKNTGDSGAVEAARRLTGPKDPQKKKKGDVNSDGVQVRTTRPDVRGPTDDAGFLTAEFQSGDPLGDDLDLQIVDRRPSEILPLREPAKLEKSFS